MKLPSTRAACIPMAWGLAGLGFVVFTSSAGAQLRFATGRVIGEAGEFEPIDPPLASTVTTASGRMCGPALPLCGPYRYPSHPFFDQSLTPVRASGAVIWGATTQGGPVQMPFADEWALTTSWYIELDFGSTGFSTIASSFQVRNEQALFATGKGFSAGGGPGDSIFNPATAPIPAATFQTLTFPSATSPIGSTAVSGVPTTKTVPSLPAQPSSRLRVRITAGPRQFGGTAAILNDRRGTFRYKLPSGLYYDWTNGRCPPNQPFGSCARGFVVGETASSITAVVLRGLADPADALTAYNRYWIRPWTTGTVSVVARIGPGYETSFGRTGTDVGGSSRRLTLVSPVLVYGRSFLGELGASGFIYSWDITFAPEPTGALGLLAALGALFVLNVRHRRRA